MFCTDEPETCNHSFLECSFAQAFWLQSPISNDYRFPSNIKFIDAMDAAIKKLTATVFETLCMACWMTWKCRNKLVFDNIAPSHKELWAQAEKYRLEFLEVQQKNAQVSVSSAATWKPPQSDSVHKLNVAIFQSKKFAFVLFGLLIHNNKGEVLVASCD